MKRVFFSVLVAALLLAGCANPDSSIIKADNISIFYGYSSYAMFGAEPKVIDDLLDSFSSLSFDKTTEEMDLASAFHVSFYSNNKNIKSFWVDRNGVFWLNGETQCYKVSSGLFDYEHLKEVYQNSKNATIPPKLPSLNYGTNSNEGLNKTPDKEVLKRQLLDMIGKMTEPTQENPFLAFSSNPYDYIEAHKDTYNSLIKGGQSTVEVFVDVLKNSTEFGLDKYIMAAVCAEITGIGNDTDKTWGTAKEWLELYEERG